jgi:hypothetical protein
MNPGSLAADAFHDHSDTGRLVHVPVEGFYAIFRNATVTNSAGSHS